MQLPRDEMAFRKRYETLLLMRAITTVFRPGDRVYPAWRGYRLGEVVVARVIEQAGCDAVGHPPVFNDDVRLPIQITSLDVIEIGAFEPAHFAGSAPDVHDRASLEAHLMNIYQKPISAFGDRVTRITFDYVETRGMERTA